MTNQKISLFSVKIDTWSAPLDIRAYSEADAEDLTRALFKVPTDVGVKAESQGQVKSNRGRKPLEIPLESIYDALKDSYYVREAAAKLGCSPGYLYKILGVEKVQSLIRSGG